MYMIHNSNISHIVIFCEAWLVAHTLNEQIWVAWIHQASPTSEPWIWAKSEPDQSLIHASVIFPKISLTCYIK